VRAFIAWTVTLVVGALAIGPASGQGTATPPKRATPAPAGPRQLPGPAPAATKGSAAPIDPNAVKAQQLALDKARQEMNDLLAEWEKQSRKVLSLDVSFERVDKRGPAWGDLYFQGRAMLKSPDLACLEFRKYKVGDDGTPLQPLKLEPDPSERIVCTGEKVLQFLWDERVIYVHPLEKEGRQKALQQGPLPFLFNMRAADVKMRYGMTLLQQDKTDYLIAIVPHEEIDKQNFQQAFLWLNKETFLPDKLRLHMVANKEVQEFRFKTIQANKPMDPGFFDPKVNLPGWQVKVNPGGDPIKATQAPPGIAAPRSDRAPVAPPRRPVPQPAMRPSNRPQ
jgi:TIGR03009 family protein